MTPQQRATLAAPVTDDETAFAAGRALRVRGWYAIDAEGYEAIHLRENHLLRNFDLDPVTAEALVKLSDAQAALAAKDEEIAALKAGRDALAAQLDAVGAGGVSALVRLHENGAKAWAGVPDATAWVDELRGNEPEPLAIHRPTALAIIERLERACGAKSQPPMLIRREFLGEVIESPWPEAVGP